MKKSFIPFLGFEASAGSGKTFNLVVRYLSLLFQDVDPSSILALTFTNKAASEMSERIIATVIDLENRGEFEVIAANLGVSKAYLLERNESIIKRVLESELNIMTIDKFFASILRKFSLYSGVQPSFSVEAIPRDLSIMQHFLASVEVAREDKSLIHLALLTQKRVSDIFSEFNQLYLKQNEFTLPKFQEANVGAFETKVLDAMQLLHDEVIKHPDASKTALNGVVFETIEDITKKSWLERDSLDYRTFSKCYTPQLDEAFFALKEALYAFYLAKESHFFKHFFELLRLYSKARLDIAKRAGELTFDDITLLLFNLLRHTIKSDFIYFRLDAKIEHILLDEFQDTSVIQFEMLRPLIEELVAGEGVHTKKSFFYVGDVKQSIYRFRGGNKALFNEVKEDFNVDMQRLNTNYRSQKEVVNFVNTTFREKIENYFDQEVATGHDKGYVEVVQSDELIASAVKGVKQLLEAGVESYDIAILTWQNADGLILEEAIKTLGVEVVTETNSKLIHHPSVAGVINLLKYYYFKERIYFESFAALLGLEDAEPFMMDITHYALDELVHKIIGHYKLFNGDQNLIRFLNLLTNYKDIDEFIFTIERQSESLTQLESIGVRILTVHKSKGLEFKHVLVMDRLGKKQADTSLILYDYDGTKLRDIFMRQKGREFIDQRYKAAKLKNMAMASEDELNAQYVAFTRAEESLFIIQKEKGSIFEPLGLSVGSLGHFEVVSKKRNVEKTKVIIPYTPLSLGLQEKVSSVKEEESLDFKALEFGQALHYTLEMLTHFDSVALQKAMQAMRNRFALSSEAYDEIESRIIRLIKDEDFLHYASGKITKEQPLAIEGKLYYIDLMVEFDDMIVVMDYKSSKEFAAHHHKQVKNYRYGVQTITQKPVSGYICYLLHSGIEIVKV